MRNVKKKSVLANFGQFEQNQRVFLFFWSIWLKLMKASGFVVSRCLSIQAKPHCFNQLKPHLSKGAKTRCFYYIWAKLRETSQSGLFSISLSTLAQYKQTHTVFIKLNYVSQNIQYNQICQRPSKQTVLTNCSHMHQNSEKYPVFIKFGQSCQNKRMQVLFINLSDCYQA